MLDDGGTILVKREIVPIFGEKDALFAGAMTAIHMLIGETTGSRIRRMDAGKYQIYFGQGDKYIVVVLSDTADTSAMRIVDRILRAIEEMGYEPEDIAFDRDIAEYVEGVIDKIIVSTSRELWGVLELANSVLSVLPLRGGYTLSIGNIEMPRHMIDGGVRVRPPLGSSNVRVLLEAFEAGRLGYVITNAPKIFLKSDLAIILYVKAAVLAWSIHMLDAPSMRYVVLSLIHI